ncbi:hypothetical protein N7456_012372 [Penicillium angulare]|uniref:Uncharacterized protein n=1 Tax=Penicillium angulare TaxID=116970 RepID=A0A9W9K126_9EURO|nr:hypothetical protein N7456_012372 [Penicillium angulare]
MVNGDLHTVASGCTGTADKGFCKFDEFIKYIQENYMGGGTEIEEADPEIWSTVNKLKTLGWTNNNLDFHKFLPKRYSVGQRSSYLGLHDRLLQTVVKNIDKWGKPAL